MVFSREERAKQFMAFDALSGFSQELKKKEIEYVEKLELSDDVQLEISEILNLIDKNDIIKVKYYKNKQYQEIIGEINWISKSNKKICLTDETIIPFDDILRIKRI